MSGWTPADALRLSIGLKMPNGKDDEWEAVRAEALAEIQDRTGEAETEWAADSLAMLIAAAKIDGLTDNNEAQDMARRAFASTAAWLDAGRDPRLGALLAFKWIDAGADADRPEWTDWQAAAAALDTIGGDLADHPDAQGRLAAEVQRERLLLSRHVWPDTVPDDVEAPSMSPRAFWWMAHDLTTVSRFAAEPDRQRQVGELFDAWEIPATPEGADRLATIVEGISRVIDETINHEVGHGYAARLRDELRDRLRGMGDDTGRLADRWNQRETERLEAVWSTLTGKAPQLDPDAPTHAGRVWDSWLWRPGGVEWWQPDQRANAVPRAWLALASGLWLARVRPQLRREIARTARYRSPALFAGTLDVMARPPATPEGLTTTSPGWMHHAGPALPVADLADALREIRSADGRAVLRALPYLAWRGARGYGRPVEVWRSDAYEVWAECVAQNQTFVRVFAPQQPDEALRRWLDLPNDGSPSARLEHLTTLSLRFALTDGTTNTGALVSDVNDAPHPDGRAGLSFIVSRVVHPAVAGTIERGALLVPVVFRRAPAYHARAAEICDTLDHAMMRRAAMLAPQADLERGAPLDVDALLHECGGKRANRTAWRTDVIQRLGLDGSAGVWTTPGEGEDHPRWIVRDGYYMPGDPDAAAMLREGWKLRQNASEGKPPPRKARRKRRR